MCQKPGFFTRNPSELFCAIQLYIVPLVKNDSWSHSRTRQNEIQWSRSARWMQPHRSNALRYASAASAAHSRCAVCAPLKRRPQKPQKSEKEQVEEEGLRVSGCIRAPRYFHPLSRTNPERWLHRSFTLVLAKLPSPSSNIPILYTRNSKHTSVITAHDHESRSTFYHCYYHTGVHTQATGCVLVLSRRKEVKTTEKSPTQKLTTDQS